MKKNTKKNIKKNFYLYGVMFILFCFGYYFVLKTFEENMMFFIDPSELIEKSATNKEIMLGGYVQDGSYHMEKEANDITVHIFVVTDFKTEIKVTYVGALPSLFREGQGVIAKGVYKKDAGFFAAKEILAKHDEKYVPKNLPHNPASNPKAD